jgi:hypothetical protein
MLIQCEYVLDAAGNPHSRKQNKPSFTWRLFRHASLAGHCFQAPIRELRERLAADSARATGRPHHREDARPDR